MSKLFVTLLLLATITLTAYNQVFYLNSNLPPVLQADAGNDNFIDPGDSVQIGGTPTALNGYGDYTYFWEPSTGLSDPMVSNPWAKPDETTTYTLTVGDGHYCLAMDELIVKVGASGIDDKTRALEITVYPNPAGDYVNIFISGNSGKIKLKIVSSLGQGIINREVVQQDEVIFTFDTGRWKKGIYYLIIQTAEVVETKAIVII